MSAVVAAAILAAVTGFWGKVFGSAPASAPPSPITVNVSLTSPSSGCEGGLGWVVPVPASALASHPGTNASTSAVDKWATDHKGVPAVNGTLTVTVQGTTSSAVVLEDLRIEIIKRSPPLTGIYPHNSAQCGGVDTRFLTVNLDAPTPATKLVTGFSASGAPVTTAFPLQVSATDPEVFRIMRTTTGCDCTWRAVLDWVAGGHAGQTVVDNHGQPFTETAVSRAVRYARDWDHGGGWIACVPAVKCRDY